MWRRVSDGWKAHTYVHPDELFFSPLSRGTYNEGEQTATDLLLTEPFGMCEARYQMGGGSSK